jgi:hypothetical protein
MVKREVVAVGIRAVEWLIGVIPAAQLTLEGGCCNWLWKESSNLWQVRATLVRRTDTPGTVKLPRTLDPRFKL